VCRCIPLSLLRNGSVINFLLKQIRTHQLNCWVRSFLCGSYYISRKVLPRTSKLVARLPESQDSKIQPLVPQDSVPRMTVLAKASSNLHDPIQYFCLFLWYYRCFTNFGVHEGMEWDRQMFMDGEGFRGSRSRLIWRHSSGDKKRGSRDVKQGSRPTFQICSSKSRSRELPVPVSPSALLASGI
jgi:hypothetical protein